ncbi:DUF1697 domain-containing protein [Paenibacillus spongiae]|uniref:DUF1697 domain-containing protein n=1 Tax=Paenibacillus spongiae TaxID=2909671 RepID=A0ABY5S589_9BACL|nr:DUF1697 domain-containing protein [Paenibacillus spongiae]UVI27493.1 DUF1697 domain-containing protein [Paenibacillus spongiae]
MKSYVAWLRGINVSGQKLIKMDHLKMIFESLQLSSVTTYIQSGNVLFLSDDLDTEALTLRIEKGLYEALGYEVPVIIRTVEELESVIANNPYDLNAFTEKDKLYVTFLSKKPSPEAVEALMAFQNEIDEFHIQDREVYILVHSSYGKTLFSNNFIEKKLRVSGTTRNWATINKMISLHRNRKG